MTPSNAISPAARVLADKTRDALAHLGSGATKGASLLGRVLRSAATDAAEFARKRRAEAHVPRTTRRESRAPEETPRRRTTSPPSALPSSLSSAGIVSKRRSESNPDLRAQQAASVPSRPANPAARRWALLGGATTVLLGAALLTRGLGGSAEKATATAATGTPTPDVALSAATPNPTQGAPISAAPATTTTETVGTPEGIVAEVPLFGPRAMATAEPVGKPSVSDAEAERLAAESVPETFVDAAPKETKPWGKGKLFEPVLHRIRLDGAGSALDGTPTKNGFSIVVPGRKALESGRTIEKRDKRVTLVKTSNTARGAQLQLEFKGPVPAYRVRLRGEYLEVLLSAVEVGVAKL